MRLHSLIFGFRLDGSEVNMNGRLPLMVILISFFDHTLRNFHRTDEIGNAIAIELCLRGRLMVGTHGQANLDAAWGLA